MKNSVVRLTKAEHNLLWQIHWHLEGVWASKIDDALYEKVEDEMMIIPNFRPSSWFEDETT